MSDSMNTRPRPGLVTRAKNANQRPGKILTNGRRTRRSPAQMAADKKIAEEATTLIRANNADTTANNDTVARHLRKLEDEHPQRRHTSTVRRSTAPIRQSRSEGIRSGNRGSSLAQAVQAGTSTRSSQRLTRADIGASGNTSGGHQIYDIVSVAQMIVAKLASSERKGTRDCVTDIEVQPYALCSYRSH